MFIYIKHLSCLQLSWFSFHFSFFMFLFSFNASCFHYSRFSFWFFHMELFQFSFFMVSFSYSYFSCVTFRVIIFHVFMFERSMFLFFIFIYHVFNFHVGRPPARVKSALRAAGSASMFLIDTYHVFSCHDSVSIFYLSCFYFHVFNFLKITYRVTKWPPGAPKSPQHDLPELQNGPKLSPEAPGWNCTPLRISLPGASRRQKLISNDTMQRFERPWLTPWTLQPPAPGPGETILNTTFNYYSLTILN